jgi:hypothetical protein
VNDSAIDGPRSGDEARMIHGVSRTLVRIAVASLVVGSIMTHFGITPEQVVRQSGLSQERLIELARYGLAWALPNLVLGALVIVPVWFLIYLFRPTRARSD